MKKKPGNIEYVLGCSFDPGWEQVEEARSVVWRVTMQDGRTCTLRIPECPTYSEAYETAKQMIPSTHSIAVPRAWAAG